MLEKNIFDSIKIGLASPDMIRSWSYGEVLKPETINYRTLKAERDGLFCEKIFGPTKDWECLCGKYKRVRYKGKICEKCHVEVTQKKVRRERMGHIELATPVSHIWYFRAIPSRMGLLLDISPRILDKVLYFGQYIVLEVGDLSSAELSVGQALSEAEYRHFEEKYEDDFRVGMGAEAVKELLQNIDIEKLCDDLKAELEKSSGQKKVKLIKRLDVAEAFRKSGNKPEWMILDVVPVIPPDLRPLLQLDGGRFATSDLNDLYRRVINRNNRLKKLQELDAPEIIIRNEKRMLQEAVDALIDNGRRGKPVTGPSSRPLKSLSEMLRGKQGRFRQNLLGKRVDYSGRSVIVVGPELKIYQCGLPKEMALELFKPFVMKRLVETQKATNIKDAKKKVERAESFVWDSLENVIKEHPVLLNRAPTLHRLSIQAFEPVLVDGRAIKLHPLVCTAFNADFDGDQMPVHVPLSAEAQAEARFLMLSASNLLKPADGKAVAVPSQDMVLGSYYLTLAASDEELDEYVAYKEANGGNIPEHSDKYGAYTIKFYEESLLGRNKMFLSEDEAVMAYENKVITLHTPIRVRVTRDVEGERLTGIIKCTLGKLIFNKPIPQNLGWVDRSLPENKLKLEIDFVVTKGKLSKIVDRCIKLHGSSVTSGVLDEIKAMGFKYSTRSSLSIAVPDMTIPKQKKELIAEAEEKVQQLSMFFNDGVISEEERYKKVVETWTETTNKVTGALEAALDPYNPLKMMSDSGARGSIKQMRQLAGMRGLMYATNGKTMEIPIKSNFREGINVLDYFIGARGSRKSLADTALRTADSGYLTRRLVDVSQEVIITETDCGSHEGIEVYEIKSGNEVIETFKERILGRFTIDPVVDPNTGEVLAEANVMLTDKVCDRIIAAGINRLNVRTTLKCHAKSGVCAHCYGMNLATSKPVDIGEAVGIIAAQSIGEPGTQLTMRTFHTGGIAGSDITQGLPRVEELFEARKPKKAAVLAEISGTVSISEKPRARSVTITPESGDAVTVAVPNIMTLKVKEGEYVMKGDPLSEGSMAPADILATKDITAVYDYIITEVQRVYRDQSVDINDKHIEVITRQMTRKVKVEDSGDTDLLSGAQIDVTEFNEAYDAVKAKIDAGDKTLMLPTCSPVLLGITKAALLTESFLSAASFQETTKVLTDAAIRGKTDKLEGLKENVIIGKLIPAGTGMDRYRKVEVEPTGKHADSDPDGYDD
ncbi:MAG: DNA-directed RNA polymerase subunit beta' [Clostridia bacterium]|nr:DNA-directed RNA polymerase subunit beta' [Clostridia bacterium]MBQ3870456.1 DNA-directed RNA polymerase subunit beta' [Clostridia bacterium]